jgi:hypothetical protein
MINIGGLAIGMSVAMLIGLWVHDELSFDRYHQNIIFNPSPTMQAIKINDRFI